MADVRLVISTSGEVRDALRLAAAELRKEMSELGDEILRDALGDYIERLKHPPTPPVGKLPKGRKST